ncbi:MAG: hypothetical protein AAF927_30100 [Bacteroidota bacterium]
MKSSLNLFLPLLLVFTLIACQACQGNEDTDIPKDPEPGEYASESNQAMMTAKVDGTDWSADYLKIVQTETKVNGNQSNFLEIRAKVGSGDRLDKLPGILLTINRRTGNAIGVEKFDIKALMDDPEVVVTLKFENDTDPAYRLDSFIDETYAELEITSLNGNNISGNFKMKLVNPNGDFVEILNGQFESAYYLFQSF